AKGKKTPKEAKPAPVVVPTGWTKWTAPEGGFSLAFPQEPAAQDLESGRTWIVQDDAANVAYMASAMARESGVDPETALDLARDGAVQNTHGTLRSEKKLKSGATTGRELVINSD